jgi:hypothetical protein
MHTIDMHCCKDHDAFINHFLLVIMAITKLIKSLNRYLNAAIIIIIIIEYPVKNKKQRL